MGQDDPFGRPRAGARSHHDGVTRLDRDASRTRLGTAGADHEGRPQHVEQALAGRRRQALVNGRNRVAVVPCGPDRLDELRAPGRSIATRSGIFASLPPALV